MVRRAAAAIAAAETAALQYSLPTYPNRPALPRVSLPLVSPDQDGNVPISIGQVTDAINQAAAENRKNGNKQNGVSVEANLPARSNQRNDEPRGP